MQTKFMLIRLIIACMFILMLLLGNCVAAPLADPCQNVTCPVGYMCTVGSCVVDPCYNITCPNDGNPCTREFCNKTSGKCATTTIQTDGIPCDDGNPCTVTDSCHLGKCAGVVWLKAPGCGEYCPESSPCDDSNPCTTKDTCQNGRCIGSPVACPGDGNVCTEDSCGPATGSCVSSPVNCDDSNPITTDFCDPSIGCVHLDHSMVFMSDPQLGRKVTRADGSEEDVFFRNILHSLSVNTMAKTTGCRGTVIVGDLTDYGHDYELEPYKTLYESSTTIFPGLGNHDYGNDDTWENRCPTNMVEYMINSVQNLNAKHPDFQVSFDMERVKGYTFPVYTDTIIGSLDYSWNIGNIHYVHLNNYPEYKRSWSNYRSDRAEVITVIILPGKEWLERDLSTARKQGKSIILNIHDVSVPYNDEDFRKLLDKFRVSAIFAGHFHDIIGTDPLLYTFNTENNSVPTFFCGSAEANKYLYASFEPDNMTVKIMDSSRGACEVVKIFDPVPLKHPATNTPGEVSVKNSGNYVARYNLSYSLGGKTMSIESGDMYQGDIVVYGIPAEATNLHLRMAGLFVTWNEFMSQDIERPDGWTDYYRSTGTLFSWNWDRQPRSLVSERRGI